MKGTSGVAEQGRNSKWNHIGRIPRPTQFEEKDEYEVYGEVKSNSVESWTLAQIYAAVKDQKPNLL